MIVATIIRTGKQCFEWSLKSQNLQVQGVAESKAEAWAKCEAHTERAWEGRAVPLPGLFSGKDGDVGLLALGFARGEPGALAVPYARRADT